MKMPTLTQIATNLVCVTSKDVDVYFSYAVCIAFRVDGRLYMSENVWSRTTGKHLNMISPDATRMPYAEFEQAWVDAV